MVFISLHSRTVSLENHVMHFVAAPPDQVLETVTFSVPKGDSFAKHAHPVGSR